MLRPSFTSVLLAAVLTTASLLGPVDEAAADSCICASGVPTYSMDGSLYSAELYAADDFELTTEWLMWCEGGNDPRCSPVQHGSGAVPLLAEGLTGTMADVASLIAPPRMLGNAPANLHLGAPRAGVAPRVERPPRA